MGLLFDGDTNWLTDFDGLPAETNFSYCCWFRLTAIDALNRQIFKMLDGSSGIHEIYVEDGTEPYAIGIFGDGYGSTIAGQVSEGEWYFACLTVTS
jgi:hypothetical protein